MLKRRDILVGECYVNENTRMAREVLEELDRFRVKYNAYDLTSGYLLRAPHRICQKRQLVHWADREATEEEKTSLQREEAATLFANEPATSAEEVEINFNGAEVLETVGRQAIGRL